jgi:hypothetical protein
MRSHLIVAGIFLIALPALAANEVPAKVRKVDPKAEPSTLDRTPVENLNPGAKLTLAKEVFKDAVMRKPEDPKKENLKTVIGEIARVPAFLHKFCENAKSSKAPGPLEDVAPVDQVLRVEVNNYSWYKEWQSEKVETAKTYSQCVKHVAAAEKNVQKQNELRALLNAAVIANNKAAGCQIEVKDKLGAKETEMEFAKDTDDVLELAGAPVMNANATYIFKFKNKDYSGMKCWNTKSIEDLQNVLRIATIPETDYAPFRAKRGGSSQTVDKSDLKSISTKRVKRTEPAAPVVTADDYVDEKGVIHKGHAPGGHQHTAPAAAPADSTKPAW